MIEDADKDDLKPSFLDPGVFAARRNSHDDEYTAALKAADAVFGGSGSAAPVPAQALSSQAPSSNSPVGRVLPSLIDEDDPLTVRLMEAEKKTRRRRGPGKAKSASPIQPKPPAHQPKTEPARVFAERPAANSPPQTSIVSAPRRERRSIQKRWVLGTELKAGEKWKRRLGKSAR